MQFAADDYGLLAAHLSFGLAGSRFICAARLRARYSDFGHNGFPITLHDGNRTIASSTETFAGVDSTGARWENTGTNHQPPACSV